MMWVTYVLVQSAKKFMAGPQMTSLYLSYSQLMFLTKSQYIHYNRWIHCIPVPQFIFKANNKMYTYIISEWMWKITLIWQQRKKSIFYNIKCIMNCIISTKNVLYYYTIARAVQNEQIITLMKLSSLWTYDKILHLWCQSSCSIRSCKITV